MQGDSHGQLINTQTQNRNLEGRFCLPDRGQGLYGLGFTM